MNERSFALYPDERVRFDKLTQAALLAAFVALFWGLAAYGRIKGRRAGADAQAHAPSTSTAAIAPAPAVADADASRRGASPAIQAPDTRLTQVGFGAALVAVMAGGGLWEIYGFFPSRPALLGYAAAAVTLAVALLLTRLGQRGEAAEAGSLPTPGVSMSALVPPAGAALLCVLRDEPGASSPSYKRVEVDGVRVADLQANSYTAVALRPGPHTLAVNTRVSLTSDTVVRFDAAAGDVVAYRLQVPFFGAMRLEHTTDVPAVRAAIARLKPMPPL